MKSTNPDLVSKYVFKEMIEAWVEKFPTEAKRLVGDALVEENASLKERLDFEVKLNRNRQF